MFNYRLLVAHQMNIWHQVLIIIVACGKYTRAHTRLYIGRDRREMNNNDIMVIAVCLI